MKKNSLFFLLILSVVSGVLLSLPYILPHCGIVALVAFLPLLTAEKIATENRKKNFWICYYTSFLVWNIISTWWIWYATNAGAIAAIILNSAQMAVIFRIFRFARKKVQEGLTPYLLLVFLWCAWEHLYQGWQVTWPWLYLGNSFAQSIKHIQWYELTGSIGGSFWILLTNILVFQTADRFSSARKTRWFALAAILVAVLPSIYSHIRYNSLGKTLLNEENRKEVVVLQPNIDPYNDKFSGKTQDVQNQILLRLADSAATPSTVLAVAPETFFNPSHHAGTITENAPVGNKTLDTISAFAESHNTAFIFGAVTYLRYGTPSKPTRTARKTNTGWTDVFNTAITVTPDRRLDFYHKSKLVIMAETVPYIGNTSVLSSFGLDLGGGFGNFGSQPRRSVTDIGNGIKTGTAICYESVFGDFFADYVREGANLMTVITNDGWWRNTAGHIQHLNYARLRAIETRRYIVRSANTGISAIINKRGDIIIQTPWWKECAIRGEVSTSQEITPFVSIGDLTGRVCCRLSLIFLVLLFFSGKRFLRGKSPVSASS